MNIIKKFVNPEQQELNVYGSFDDPYFKANQVSELLEKRNNKTEVKYIPEEYRKQIILKTIKGDRSCTMVNEAGLYYMIMRSDKPQAIKFQKWVVSDVLPTIRKTGRYEMLNKKPFKITSYKMENEYDLHTKVVDFIKQYYPHALYSVGLGELQDTQEKRVLAYKMGYQSGECDIIINNLNKKWNGLVIELKSPKGIGALKVTQDKRIENYKKANYKVLVSNDYDEAIREIIFFMEDVRVKCTNCNRLFKSEVSLAIHQKWICCN